MGKSTLKIIIEAIACHLSPPAMLGKGGGSELTGMAGKCDGSAVVQSVLIKMLRFKQQD